MAGRASCWDVQSCSTALVCSAKHLEGCCCANAWRVFLWLLPVITYAAVRYADLDPRKLKSM